MNALVTHYLSKEAPEAWQDNRPAILESRLRQAVTRLMHQLSDLQGDTETTVNWFWDDKPFSWTCSNIRFEQIAQPLLERTSITYYITCG